MVYFWSAMSAVPDTLVAIADNWLATFEAALQRGDDAALRADAASRLATAGVDRLEGEAERELGARLSDPVESVRLAAAHALGAVDSAYELAVGKLTVDLRDVDFSGHRRRVQASVGIGDLDAYHSVGPAEPDLVRRVRVQHRVRRQLQEALRSQAIQGRDDESRRARVGRGGAGI